MRSYLTEEELALYTDQPITMLDAENATLAIDAHKGRSFFSKLFTERVALLRQSRGRLKHRPRVEIVGVETMLSLPFGMQKMQLGTDAVVFDDEDSPYFTFYMPQNPVFPTPVPKIISVTYYAGYETVPEELKFITAQLAANLRAFGGGLKWETREDFDLKITLTKDGVFTNEMRRAIDLLELS